ncbi:hypothetical protein M2T37_28255, partial [Klebsiella pneumoniae]|uniref:hypothetical protein n=1 Tax=Klebsiella pneumoniae TaxID=573 RepID=UPI00200EF804
RMPRVSLSAIVVTVAASLAALITTPATARADRPTAAPMTAVADVAAACAELRDALHGVPTADVAEILAELEPNDAAVAFRFLLRDDAAEAFA